MIRSVLHSHILMSSLNVSFCLFKTLSYAQSFLIPSLKKKSLWNKYLGTIKQNQNLEKYVEHREYHKPKQHRMRKVYQGITFYLLCSLLSQPLPEKYLSIFSHVDTVLGFKNTNTSETWSLFSNNWHSHGVNRYVSKG